LKNSKKKQKEKEFVVVNKIICGDSISCLRKMPSECVDLIITSPPYFKQRTYIEGKDLEIGNEEFAIDYLDILDKVFSECLRVCKRNGNIVFNLGDKYLKGDLALLPYRFAIRVKDRYSPPLKLINNITWVKSNPTPRQYDRRLVNSTEPFFHFARSKDYYYDRDAFQYSEIEQKEITATKGLAYLDKIYNSRLTDTEKIAAVTAMYQARQEISDGKITDFRMKIRGVHKLAFGGQQGGRNNEIKNNGFTVIKMTGQKMKRDVIESPVDNNKGIDHPAIFPLKVIKDMVLLLSPQDGIVLDPFCGSGTTCLAAKELNRKYIGIDLSEKFCDMSRERLK
jgi:site-specific DNA-methyltransferase (adenine-specific)